MRVAGGDFTEGVAICRKAVLLMSLFETYRHDVKKTWAREQDKRQI